MFESYFSENFLTEVKGILSSEEERRPEESSVASSKLAEATKYAVVVR